MAFYPQGAMSQISHSSDKIKFSFVIFLQSFSSYSTEQESHRRQKKKIFMNFLFWSILSNKEVIFVGDKSDITFIMITTTNYSLNQNVLSLSSE